MAVMAISASIQAKVKLPSVFSDNMVLQQKENVAVWGKADGKKVTITTSWSKKKTVVTPEADGNWFVRLATPEAGGPYTITFSDGEKTTLRNVLTGEVWYCSGQSNMEMPMKGFAGQPVEHAAEFIMSASPRVPIRICEVPNVKMAVPADTTRAVWKENTPETVARTSAVAYFFAIRMHQALNVPIGLIIADWGGSAIESWLCREVIEGEFPGEFDTSVLDSGDIRERPNTSTPCILYNGMVAALEPFTFKGMLWYQGETNRPRPQQYVRLQTAYVRMMREKFHNPGAPFYFVQIAPYPYQPQYQNLFTAGYFNEAQQKTLSLIPHSGMVATGDLGSFSTIHPPKKKEIGDRLAFMTLVNDYGLKGIDPAPPTFSSVEFGEGEAIVIFDTDSAGPAPLNQELGGFEIAGQDRVFHPAHAIIKDKKVRVWSIDVPNPVAVRYCFRNRSNASVFNAWGIPAVPFRTDNWDDLRE